MRPVDDDKLDLSPLDPTLDAAGFEAMVQSIAARAARQIAAAPEEIMLRWWRPALALAASMAMAAWGPSLLAARQPTSASAQDPAAALLQWSRGEGASSAAEILESLGASR